MTSKEAKQVLMGMFPTIAHYDIEVRQQIALRMAIEALDAAEKQEKNDEALMRIAETFEKVNAAITDIADHFGSQMAMFIDTLEPIAKVFRDDDEAAADADETCDNDCEHCDFVTCPKEEARMSEDKYEIELKLSDYELKKIFEEYGTGKYCLIEDTPTFKLLIDRAVKKMEEAADERHS